jgi:hypothetical protein
LIKNVLHDSFRIIAAFSFWVIAYAFVKSGITGNPPEFPLSGELLPWIVLTVAALAGSYIRQRKLEKK